MHFLRSKWMSMSPLCGKLVNFYIVPRPAREKLLTSDLLGPILSTSGPNARKCQNRTSWGPFCRLLDPRLENAEIGPPGIHFVDFWIQTQKMLKSDILGPFCRFLDPRPENAKIGPPGTHFADFWTQGQKMLKSDLLGPILSASGPKARKF